MTNLKSTYSKNMFRLLKQYKHTGYMKIKISDFRERLDIPKSYRMTDINKNVFKPILKELSTLFKNLTITKIKAKKGRKIEWIEFTFDAEKRIRSKRQPSQTENDPSMHIKSREMTPPWLKDNHYQTIETRASEFTDEEREAFLKKYGKSQDV